MLLPGVMAPIDGTYDEALERFHQTGPEFDGWLSNHGPMVVEALSRRHQAPVIHRWTDSYLQRLDDLPRGVHPISPAEWREPLGDATRTGDWVVFFEQAVAEMPWQTVLSLWWPRLLPGIAAGATHGVIRVGHALRALQEVETRPRVAELAHALAYWAARWQPVPIVRTVGSLGISEVLPTIPRIPRQESGIRTRLAQLDHTSGWLNRAGALAGPGHSEAVPQHLDAVVDAVLRHYVTRAHGNATMLVHAATAPNAVAMALPSLPPSLWRDSFDAVWSATAAVVAAYTPADPRPRLTTDLTASAILDRAVDHGGEHVIKFTDTAVRAHERSDEPDALAAAMVAIELDA